MNWKLVPFAFVVGILLGILLGFSIPGEASAPGNYTLILDSNYKDFALYLINSANSSIYLALYSAKYYQGGNNDLLDSLCEASSRGVTVNVILDDELDYNKDTVRFLNSCGVKAALDSPKTRLHAKFLIVDGKLVLLGSTNWSYSSLNKNHEVDVLISDPEISSELREYFEEIANVKNS